MGQAALVAAASCVISDAGSVTANDSTSLPLTPHVGGVGCRVSRPAFIAPTPVVPVPVGGAVARIASGETSRLICHESNVS